MSKKSREIEGDKFDAERFESFMAEQLSINFASNERFEKMNLRLNEFDKNFQVIRQSNEEILSMLKVLTAENKAEAKASRLSMEVPVDDIGMIIHENAAFEMSSVSTMEAVQEKKGGYSETLTTPKVHFLASNNSSSDVRRNQEKDDTTNYWVKDDNAKKVVFAPATPGIPDIAKLKNDVDFKTYFRSSSKNMNGIDDSFHQRLTTESWHETLPSTNMILHIYDYYARFQQFQLKNGSRVPFATTIDRAFYSAAMIAYATEYQLEIHSTDDFLRLQDEMAFLILVEYLKPKTKIMWIKNLLMMFARYKVPPYPPNAFNAQIYYQTALSYTHEFNILLKLLEEAEASCKLDLFRVPSNSSTEPESVLSIYLLGFPYNLGMLIHKTLFPKSESFMKTARNEFECAEMRYSLWFKYTELFLSRLATVAKNLDVVQPYLLAVQSIAEFWPKTNSKPDQNYVYPYIEMLKDQFKFHELTNRPVSAKRWVNLFERVEKTPVKTAFVRNDDYASKDFRTNPINGQEKARWGHHDRSSSRLSKAKERLLQQFAEDVESLSEDEVSDDMYEEFFDPASANDIEENDVNDEENEQFLYLARGKNQEAQDKRKKKFGSRGNNLAVSHEVKLPCYRQALAKSFGDCPSGNSCKYSHEERDLDKFRESIWSKYGLKKT